ncbi:indole-3-acetaldehyde oxidase-like isoform X3 [Hyposmocoma kahamanoa]|uniref:indole-3-acetaldehyde oxidase-like isoform X3 n=1 Tax=Hyposmocoma kahamanoa TaxID=1477025 RepID=UPI000E6D7B2C|nr:indole-3-acetaldehyde oxidase-like isoform X3 [Hyposmocoma kahamanoa]
MDKITFSVNGKKCEVGGDVDSDVSLNDYIRERLNLRGTKYMCKEGGCGACIVAVSTADDTAPRVFSVNSCLVSVTSCHGWQVTTVEGLGDRRRGYHPLQRALAEHNGSQCGYCSPGWVMAMYGLLESSDYNLTQRQIENSFGSNVCRCTGFRPILDAFKTFAKDAPKPNEYVTDIEDLTCRRGGGDCTGDCRDWCIVQKPNDEAKIIKIKLKDNRIWYRVKEVKDIFAILEQEGDDSYMLVNGNTGKGAVPVFDFPRVLIDIQPVEELKGYYVDQNLVVGAGSTLTNFMDIMLTVAHQEEEFGYLLKLHEHLDLVAHIPVRNIGTIAGNLMLKHRQPTFSSDVYLLLESTGAVLTIASKESVTEVLPEQFLHLNMTGKVITHVKLPPLSHNYEFVSFKVMPRSQNAHASVNAAFLYQFDPHRPNEVVSARIVFGGLSAYFTHASHTEQLLIGQNLFTNKVLQEALHTLELELKVENIAGELTPEYRKKCALGLFYKGLLTIIPQQSLKPWYRSGVSDLRKSRPLSKGTEVYDTNPDIWPINEPMPKVDALIQCAGEAKYVNDLPTQQDEVFCAFVTSDIGTGVIEEIDPSPALVGVNDLGEIQYLEYHYYADNGYVVNEPLIGFAGPAIRSCYDSRRWSIKTFNVTTDTPSNSFCRAPGTFDTIALTEYIMEQISYVLDKDPLEVRLNNLSPNAPEVNEMIQTLVKDAEYEKRKKEVKEFNQLNRWKKRGLRVALMRWPAGVIVDYLVTISIYHGDGSLVVKHGGVDIGQGKNTKVIQVIAYTLNIKTDKVKVKPTDVASNPNTSVTGGSTSTGAVCFGAVKCCQIILDRLAALREELNNPTWEELILNAYLRGINLQASYRVTPNDITIHRSGGAAFAEVELDILTGEHEIRRVDIIEDVGTSLNPEIDIGQIEGGFVMGVGYWTSEHQIVAPSGEVLTDRTWNYHVPLAKDIPIDFRVQLRRNSFNPTGVIGAKAVGEPPTTMAVCVAFALREAIAASREDSGIPQTQWFNVDGPYTLEANVLKANAHLEEFLFN